MTTLARLGIRPPESEMEAFLRRNEVTPWQAYQLGAGEPCPHCGAVRRTAGEQAAAPVISRASGQGFR